MTARKPSTPPADETDAVGVEGGRKASTYTDVHDWVTFSNVSPAAKALYVILRAHVNRTRADDTVWTSSLALAKIMTLSRGDKIKPYTDELIKIDAIKKKGGGTYNRNIFVVHEQPPPGYAGPKTPGEWHARNKRMLDEIRDAEKATREARRAKAKAAKSGADQPPAKVASKQSKPRSKPVTPKTGELATGAAVPPDTGELVPPDTGELVHPISGREQDVVELDVLEQTPPTPRAEETAPADVGVKAERRGDDLQTANLNEVVDAAVAARDGAQDWTLATVRRAIRNAQSDGWSDALIVEALAQLATDIPRPGHAGTQYPARLKHWLAAHARADAAPEGAETLPASYVMPADRPRCRTHPGYPGDNCTACVKDAEIAAREAAAGASVPSLTGPALPVHEARALARRAARRNPAAPESRLPVMPRQVQGADVDPATVLEALGAVSGRETVGARS